MSQNTNVWCRGRGGYRYGATKEISKVGIKLEASPGEKKNMINEVSLPAEGMKQQPKKDDVGAAGNIGKPESTRKDVNRTLDLNPGWGDFAVPVDVNRNRIPVVVNSSHLVSINPAETHSLQKKKEDFNVGIKLEASSNQNNDVIDETSLPAEVIKQQTKKDGVEVAGNIANPESIHDSVMISRADLVKLVSIADQFLDNAESLRSFLRSLTGSA